MTLSALHQKQPQTMRSWFTPTPFILLLSLFLLSFTPHTTDATALTYRLAAHEKGCFYLWADQVDKKLSFYFAVQTGGSFDVDYIVTDPKGRVILTGVKERQGDYVFVGKEVGEYSFCFSNGMSTFAEKVVDFEIAMEHEAKPAATVEASKSTTPGEEHANNMEEVLFRISGRLSSISRSQKHFRTREHRNYATVKSTENRIFWFAILQSGLVVTVAVLQVFMVRTFFSATKKGHV